MYQFLLQSSSFAFLSHITQIQFKGSAKTKRCSFAHGLLYSNSLGKQIVMKDKSLRSVSIFVSDAVKHCMRSRSDGINQLRSSNIRYYESVSSCLCWPACKAHLFCAALCCHAWSVRMYRIFPRFLNSTIFGKKVLEHTMCVLIFSACFV